MEKIRHQLALDTETKKILRKSKSISTPEYQLKMDEYITIDGVCISRLGFSKELQQAPAFVNALTIINELRRKEAFVLRKKIEKLETLKKRQDTIIYALIEDFGYDFIECDECGTHAADDQELMRSCECLYRSCDWCFDTGKCLDSWIPQNEIDDGTLWCTQCETTIIKL